MLTNYHSHTYLCKHAQGYIEDYFLEAKTNGLSVLGFSDHCPYPNDYVDTWPNVRMTKQDSYQYVRDIKNLADAERENKINLKNQTDSQDSSVSTKPIEIYSGFECEWDPRYKNWFEDFLLGELDADFLAFGPHWVNDSGTFIYAPEIKTKKLLFKYFDSIVEGIASGLYSYVAHPDIIMAYGRVWDENVKDGFTAIIDASIEHNIPLEINGQGLLREKIRCEKGERAPYPYDPFWELVLERNIPVICNSDAHRPQDLVHGLHKARDYAQSMNLEIISRLAFKKKF